MKSGEKVKTEDDKELSKNNSREKLPLYMRKKAVTAQSSPKMNHRKHVQNRRDQNTVKKFAFATRTGFTLQNPMKVNQD